MISKRDGELAAPPTRGPMALPPRARGGRDAPRRCSARPPRSCSALASADFVDFAGGVVGEPAPPPDPRADGIVVLTGGAARIDGALQLLAEGRGKRLLISGVNPAVTPPGTRLDASTTASAGILDCCVDLDQRGAGHVGNAAETRDWADRAASAR